MWRRVDQIILIPARHDRHLVVRTFGVFCSPALRTCNQEYILGFTNDAKNTLSSNELVTRAPRTCVPTSELPPLVLSTFASPFVSNLLPGEISSLIFPTLSPPPFFGSTYEKGGSAKQRAKNLFCPRKGRHSATNPWPPKAPTTDGRRLSGPRQKWGRGLNELKSDLPAR